MLARYTRWLHTQWPAGTVEKLPRVEEDGSTNIKGLYVVGDLGGVPLLKFSSDTGARAARTIAAELEAVAGRGRGTRAAGVRELVIVGAGVSGVAAAIEARQQELDFEIIEANEPFSTIANFPKGKPIYTYPPDMVPTGELQLTAELKEPLLAELEALRKEHAIEPRRARAESVKRRAGGVLEVVLSGGEVIRASRVIVALGRSGNHRKLGVPGEDSGKVFNRLHDPADFAGKDVLVVGGGDSACETAIALAQCGARVSLSYRGEELNRPKPENVERLERLRDDPLADVQVEEPVSERETTATGPFLGASRRAGSLRLMLGTGVRSIDHDSVTLLVPEAGGEVEERIDNDVVFSMIGREAPLEFFRRSGVKISGETAGFEWIGIIAFFLAMWWVYDWKSDGFVAQQFPALREATSFPNNMPAVVSGWGDWWSAAAADRSTIVGTVAISLKSRSFYYTLVYTLCIGFFGVRRIRRRKTPYVQLQTVTLFLIQAIPLFLLPEVLLPWAGYNGAFDAGAGKVVADNLFESYISAEQYQAAEWPEWGHPRAYWRGYGFILAWPLMVYNVFSEQPMTWWLVISFVQTFLIIPVLVYFWGKGAYCGWICSCGGLAETLGDAHRHRMPHGPMSNRLNMVGQGILALAGLLLVIRIGGWIWPESWLSTCFLLFVEGKNSAYELVNPLSWKWLVDVGIAGIVGVGLYFKYSGRVWCRFACPLAALMHIYARFSRFRILPEKKKCISCNVCTSVCHMGIDVMNFANKGLPMADPQCVRCSACVQSCPTGVLAFGRVEPATGIETGRDRLSASLVRFSER